MKMDSDVKEMSPAALRAEVMRLRRQIDKELAHTGNHRCWATLLEASRNGRTLQPLSLPREMFARYCARYWLRNQPDGCRVSDPPTAEESLVLTALFGNCEGCREGWRLLEGSDVHETPRGGLAACPYNNEIRIALAVFGAALMR